MTPNTPASKPELRRLGRTDLLVSPICLGGNVFGWTADEATAFRLLDAWVDAGMNFIDTADVYSTWVPGNAGGESETILGKWFKKGGKRDRVVLATKVGKDMGAGGKGLSAGHIHAAVEASLRRLQTDRIDLYQSHEDDRETPLEETLGAFDALIRQGKVRVIGASQYEAPRLREALATSERLGLARYECLQPHYNLVERPAFEAALQAVAVEAGLGVITYWALASGFLTGKYRSSADLGNSARRKAVEPYLNPRGMAVLEALDNVAERIGATPARVALAWQLAKPSVTAPIASATSIEQLDGLVAASRLSLDADAMRTLDAASA